MSAGSRSVLSIRPVPAIATPKRPRRRVSDQQTFLTRWSSFVDRGTADLLWSGLVLVGLVLKVIVLSILTPFAWLGLGATRAVQELRNHSNSDKE